MSLHPSSSSETRKKSYKSAINTDEARRRREDDLIEIRKNKREDNLLKKRIQSLLPSEDDIVTSIYMLSETESEYQNLPENLSEMAQEVWSDNPVLQVKATTQFRKVLEYAVEYSPVKEIIEAGVIPRFVQFLSIDNLPQLQLEAACILTNIATGTSEQAQAVFELGAVPKFVQLLSSPSKNVRELVVWTLGNIAASPAGRNLVLENGGFMPLLAQFNEHAGKRMLMNAIWTLSKFFQGNPPLPFEQTLLALEKLRYLIYSSDEDIIWDACLTLHDISNAKSVSIQSLIDSGICPRLIELVYWNPNIALCALKIVGYIVSGNNEQIQTMIDNGVLPCLLQCLTLNCEKHIKKTACSIISNITAGNGNQIQAVFDSNIIGPLIHLLQHEEFKIKKEAAWAISNATIGGSDEQIRYLVNEGCIKPLCDLLACPDSSTVRVCLEALENIAKVGEIDKESGKTSNGVNAYAKMIMESDGLSKIEKLQIHDNSDIYDKSLEILDRIDVDEED